LWKEGQKDAVIFQKRLRAKLEEEGIKSDLMGEARHKEGG